MTTHSEAQHLADTAALCLAELTAGLPANSTLPLRADELAAGDVVVFIDAGGWHYVMNTARARHMRIKSTAWMAIPQGPVTS